MSRRTRPLSVLLTGATGVVGSALLPALSRHDVTCLLRLTSHAGPEVAKSLRGDIRLPRLGLPPGAYARLASTTDVIVHAAADTSFGSGPALADTNVTGTARVLELAHAAQAHLVHISTAFVSVDADRMSPALSYPQTKARAEELVRSSGLSSVIIRPSIVVGDSRTGRISKHQGFHKVLGAMMRGLLPIVPLDPGWLLDFVPQDVVADAVNDAVERQHDRRHDGDVLWMTAGSRALTLGTIADEVRAAAERFGRHVPPVRFVEEEMYRRLIEPVFLQAIPVPVRLAMTTLAEQLSMYMAVRRPFPSSLASLPDPVHTLRATVHGWAEDSRLTPRGSLGAKR